MEDLKSVIAKNITDLRISNEMTQFELAEKLNYSDKAVSKWERGESIPELSTLIAISDLFGVSLDYLVKEKHEKKSIKAINSIAKKIKLSNHAVITGMSIVLVFFIALLVFVILDITVPGIKSHWLSFVYTLPASMIVWLVLNSVWFNKRRNFLIVSLLIWSVLFAFHISYWAAGQNIWQIYILGVPAQAVVIMWSKLKFKKIK